jgi:endonuclease/exonuclease/phosphatase (EEP) superfamily protein YafD
MIPRILGALFCLAVALVAAVFAWPQAVGLARTWPIANVVALRGSAVVLVVAGLLLLLFLSAVIPPLRGFLASLMIVLVLFVAANTAVLAVRGLGFDAATRAASTPTGDIRVFSWNTLGAAPGPITIARLAAEADADVVTLPETTHAQAVVIARYLKGTGRPMRVFSASTEAGISSRSTSLLVARSLGRYRLASDDLTHVVPTIVAEPVDGTGPTLVAVHTAAPVLGQVPAWSADLTTVLRLCREPDTILAGDFNATVDHMRTLSGCSDAAVSTGSGGVGTWPTRLPALVSAPIDHVLYGARWHAVDAQVVTGEDDAGSDHRPIIATLSRR